MAVTSDKSLAPQLKTARHRAFAHVTCSLPPLENSAIGPQFHRANPEMFGDKQSKSWHKSDDRDLLVARGDSPHLRFITEFRTRPPAAIALVVHLAQTGTAGAIALETGPTHGRRKPAAILKNVR
jgi:hypothetical protein